MKSRRILITGASRGLGAALAKGFAAPDVELFLTARSIAALSEVQAECVRKGARAHCLDLDLSQPERVLTIFEEDAFSIPFDLVIANAGIYAGRGVDGLLEDWSEQSRQLAVNLTGTIQLLDGLALAMKVRRQGHLVLVSSLAAMQPQPDSPAYSASKAGLAAWGRAMGEDLPSHGVRVTVAYPGHIESDQTAVHAGALPGMVSADKAARILIRGIEKKRERIIFPYYLYLLIFMSNLLPGPVRRWVNRPFRYYVKLPDNEPSNEAEQA